MHVLTPVHGYVVLTQTCDLIRDEKPYIELCPLAPVDKTTYGEVKKLKRPNFAHIPALDGMTTFRVADLDRTLTIGKEILSEISHYGEYKPEIGSHIDSKTELAFHGVTTTEEKIAFSAALARKRSRFAFPDDFNKIIKNFIRALELPYASDARSLLKEIKRDSKEKCYERLIHIAKELKIPGSSDKDIHKNLMDRVINNTKDILYVSPKTTKRDHEVLVIADWKKTPCEFSFLFIMDRKLEDATERPKWDACCAVWAILITESRSYDKNGEYRIDSLPFDWRSRHKITLDEYQKGQRLDLDSISIKLATAPTLPDEGACA